MLISILPAVHKDDAFCGSPTAKVALAVQSPGYNKRHSPLRVGVVIKVVVNAMVCDGADLSSSRAGRADSVHGGTAASVSPATSA